MGGRKNGILDFLFIERYTKQIENRKDEEIKTSFCKKKDEILFIPYRFQDLKLFFFPLEHLVSAF